MKKILFTLLIFILTGCQLCSVRVYLATVSLTADNQVCLSISPDDFDKKSRFRVGSWNVYYYDKKDHSVIISEKNSQEITDSVSNQHDVIVSPGECILIKFNISPGDYDFSFTTGYENDLINTGYEEWRGTFAIDQDTNGKFHLTDKKGAK